MNTIDVAVPDELREFIDAQVAAGGYPNASDYIQQLVREARRRKAEERLEELLLEGLDSGPTRELTKDEWADIRREVDERLKQTRGS